MKVCLVMREPRHGLITSEGLIGGDSANWQTIVLIGALDISRQWIQEPAFSLPLKHLIDLTIEVSIILTHRWSALFPMLCIFYIFPVKSRCDWRYGQRVVVASADERRTSIFCDILRTFFNHIGSLRKLDVVSRRLVLQMAVTKDNCIVRLLILKQAKHSVVVFGGRQAAISWEPLPYLVQVDVFGVYQIPLIGFVRN